MVAGDIAESFAFLRGERPVILKTILLVAGINLTLSAFIIIGAPVTVDAASSGCRTSSWASRKARSRLAA